MRDIAGGVQDLTIQNDDKKISLALMISFTILIVQYFILSYFNLLESESALRVQLISKILVGLAYLNALPAVFKRSKTKAIWIYGLSILVFFLHYAIFPENREYILRILFPYFSMSLPAFIYALSLRDFEVLKKVMGKSSYYIFFIGSFLGILVFIGSASIGAYSMTFSYYMLFPTILFLDEVLDKFSPKYIFLTLISLLIIISYGARGPLLCIVTFITLKLFRPNSNRTFRRVLGHFSIAVIAMIFMIFWKNILIYLYSNLQRIGINSRSLALLIREDIFLSGRDQTYKLVVNEIMNRPILGIGIAGDRRILGGGYVHNFFIEVLGNFGIGIGLIIILTIILLVSNSLLTKHRSKYNMTIIWLSLGFVHLILSSSYLIDIKFWIFLGIILNRQIKTRTDNWSGYTKLDSLALGGRIKKRSPSHGKEKPSPIYTRVERVNGITL